MRSVLFFCSSSNAVNDSEQQNIIVVGTSASRSDLNFLFPKTFRNQQTIVDKPNFINMNRQKIINRK